MALRNAITDLTATFGSRYPDGGSFLARLDEMGQCAQLPRANFEKLRRQALIANPLVSGQPLLYVVRSQYRPDHHNTETMFQMGECNTGSYQPGGPLMGSCYDRPWGALAILDRRRGVDGRAPILRTWPARARNLVSDPGAPNGGFDSFTAVAPKYEDPYPLSDKYFLCSRMTGKGEEMGIYLVDVFGNEILLHAEGAGCYDPMPLGPRPRPPVIPSRRDFNNSDGYLYVRNVQDGTHLKGVKPGSVKFLRVVESPEKRFWTEPGWNGQGVERPGMQDFGKDAGKKLNLAGDRGLIFNVSYVSLWTQGALTVAGAGAPEIQQPYSWGSHASKL